MTRNLGPVGFDLSLLAWSNHITIYLYGAFCVILQYKVLNNPPKKQYSKTRKCAIQRNCVC